MGVDAQGQLQHLYWGGPLWRMDDVPSAVEKRDLSSFDPHQMLENEEFPGWGGPRYDEPALKITRANGDRDQVLTLLRELEAAGRIRRTGQRRSTRWHVITDEDRIRERAAELASRRKRTD